MDESPEVIRQQMEQTRSQLTDKLDCLEHQVSETVQSTGAVVEAIQVTVENVTGAVQSVRHALSLRSQMNRHPLLVLGGAAVIGYLAGRVLTGRSNGSAALSVSATGSGSVIGRPGDVNSVAKSADIAIAYATGLKDSSRDQMKLAALGALLGIVRDIAVRAIDQQIRRPTDPSDDSQKSTGQSPVRDSSKMSERLRIVPTNSCCSSNS
ncbi:MAG: hypothetical protein JSS49_14490 [Planctomycetes bacterium]|nr:hypothetical protein [Planctomycetota bacterium]